MNLANVSTFSFIVPVLNGDKYIRQCLEYIVAEMDSSDELIVVDNGSTDNTVKIIKEFAQVRLLEHPGVTISTLRNRGAKAARKSILAFIDSDCLVCSGWRRAALSVFTDPSIKVTGSIYDLPESPTWVEKAWYSFRRTTPTDTNLLLGGNLVVDKEVFESIGGFDEKLITDEDSDISLRLSSKGHRLREEPNVRVIHLGNAKTLGQFYRKRKWHSTSILDSMLSQGLDKPMGMTLMFIFACIVSLASLIAMLFVSVPLAMVIVPIIAIPLITVLYRFWQHRHCRHFFKLWLLYLIFYVARSVAFLEALIGSGVRNQGLTNKDRGK